MHKNDSRLAAESWRPAFDSILLAILALFTVQAFRLENHVSSLTVWIENGVFLVVPILIFWRICSSQTKATESVSQMLLGGAVLFSLAPIVTQALTRSFGIGDSIEVVMLLIVQCAAWYLTIFSAIKSFGRAAFVLFSAQVLIVCYMTEQRLVLVFALLYFTCGLWWLMGTYWSRVNTKALDGESQTLPIRWSFFAVTAVLLSVIGFFTWLNRPALTATSLSGFMPTSGGDKWAGAYARSGLGDGDMLVGGQDATTTGAVDSDQFIEDTKSSIYDMMSEKFDEPVVPNKERNKAIALEGMAKHMHNVIQSEQSGKTFRTLRKGKTEKKRDYESRIANAEFFVEGSVPVRFALATYNHFNGMDWSNNELDSDTHLDPLLQLETINDKPWYVIRNQDRKFLRNYRCHKLKMMRLKTKVLPSPAFLKSWHIYKVDLKNLFEWGSDGLINIAGESIAPQTVIDMVSSVPNLYELHDTKNLILKDHPNPAWEWLDMWLNVGSKAGTSVGEHKTKFAIDSSTFTALPKNESKNLVIRLANRWTQDTPDGWPQVEAIVNKFRTQFRVDTMNVPPADCDDPVGYFLESGSGPVYLFATAASQVLRAAGYQTRLTSGFLVQEEDYVPSSYQSIVTSDNVHVWPEVCLEGWHWIPVEPTPGFPLPYSTMTWWQWTKATLGGACVWVVNHPLVSFSIFSLSTLAFWFRGYLIAFLFWLVWQASSVLFPHRHLQFARQLIDARFKVAGLPRPDFEPISSWYRQVDERVGNDFFYHWQLANFSSRWNPDEMFEKSSDASRQIVAALTFKKIKNFVRNQQTQEPSNQNS